MGNLGQNIGMGVDPLRPQINGEIDKVVRSAQTAPDARRGLRDGQVDAVLPQQIAGGQTRRAGPDDDDLSRKERGDVWHNGLPFLAGRE